MNGEDLKFLAERSWALEDRTPDRLVDVHARIAAVRRRRVATAVASAAAVLVVLAVGIALATTGTNGARPDPAPTPSPAPGPNAAVSMPAEGTCWAVPAKSMASLDYWVDDSPQVPCEQKHTTETAVVLVLDKPTVEEARNRMDLCDVYVRQYLGVDLDNWIPWGWAALLPSQEQIDDGASWMRCDLWFPTSWDFASARSTTRSGAGLADNPPPDHWVCLNAVPTDSDQPFVPCDKPHAYEATGALTLLGGLTEYPTAGALADAVREQCRPAIPHRFRDVSVTAAWSPESAFTSGNDVLGVCFVYNPDGSPLPSR